jgi:hypothetical protein
VPLRKSPRRQLEQNLTTLLKKGNSTQVKLDKLTERAIKRRIEAIKMWDQLSRYECPLCGAQGDLKLDSKAKRAIYLQCRGCSTHYSMSVSRSLGAKVILR